jgi:hypothetical protein
MRIDVTWTICEAHAGDQPCAICEKPFWLGPATAQAISDDDVILGEVCPACLLAGPEHMADQLERRAMWSRLQAEEDEVFAGEDFGDVPTLDEFLALEAVLQTPLYATVEEAEAKLAFKTEPGGARSPAGRKESLVEQRQHVGGVGEEQRSAQERRFEDLGLERFFWSFVRLQARVDDLEEQVRELRDAGAGQS